MGNGKIFFFWGGTGSVETWDVNFGWYRKVAGAVQKAIQHYYIIHNEKNRATTQTLLDHFFKREDRTCDITVRHEWNCSLPSKCYCPWFFSSSTSHLLSLLQSVILPAFSLDASHCTALPYFSRYSTVKLKMFPFFVFAFLIFKICPSRRVVYTNTGESKNVNCIFSSVAFLCSSKHKEEKLEISFAKPVVSE